MIKVGPGRESFQQRSFFHLIVVSTGHNELTPLYPLMSPVLPKTRCKVKPCVHAVKAYDGLEVKL
jgi:hypothetical protein